MKRRSLLFSTLLMAVAGVSAQPQSGCNGSPCLLPAQAQATALFNQVEAQYPQLFFPAGRTQSQLLGSDQAYYRVYGNSWGLATYQGGLWYRSGTQWLRYTSLDQGDTQFCSAACLATDVAAGSFQGTIMLGAPTSNSVVISLLAPEQSGSAFIEYGTQSGVLNSQSASVSLVAGEPARISLTGLSADTAYFYRVQFVAEGKTTAVAGKQNSFRTARPAGATFTFTVQADSHMDENSVTRMYHRTLANVLAAKPDFHIDLGDTFMTEKHYSPLSATSPPAASEQQVVDRYLFERNNFADITAAVPLFLANGNHEGELGWLNTGGSNNLPNWAAQARQKYFVNPAPNTFYSGDTSSNGRSAWYAWQWGDALFIVLDPFWNSSKAKGVDGWSMTLGDAQYRWLETTLANSRAAFKFVFLHNLVGGLDGQMRGGIEAAPYFEWGGYDSDGVTKSFASKRPGWTAPIHELLVRHGVSAVFHGHDHLFVKQDLDGIVYQEVPQPSALNTNNAANLARDYHYNSGTAISSAGHLRITVTPDQVTAAYVRTWLPEQENNQRKNGQIDFQWTLNRKP